MRSLIPALLAVASAAPALDTPLVLRVQGNPGSTTGEAMIVNPSSGVVTYYEAGQRLTLQASAQFVLDLDILEKSIFREQGGVSYSRLRVGSGGGFGAEWNVNTESLVAALKPEALSKAIREAENNYWSKEHPFDGVVRAAWNRTYLMLAIPSKHAVLFYQTDPQSITRLAWINYGPLLMMPTGYNTNPSPQDTFRALPPLQKKQLEDEQKKAEEAQGDQPRETPKSDCWVCAAQNDTFVLVDTANNRVMSFQCTNKKMNLQGVRNLTYELKLPEGYTFQSDPPGAQTLMGFVGDHKKEIQAAGLEPYTKDEYLMRAMVKVMGTPKGSGAGGAGGLQASTLDASVLLDFTGQHKLIALNPTGGSLDLVSLRDYTMDLAASSLAEILTSRNAARNLVQQAEKNSRSHGAAMNMLKFALKLDPSLVDVVEKDHSFVPELSKGEGDWGPMLDQAHKDKDAQAERAKQIADLAKKMKEDDENLMKPKPKEGDKPKDGGDNGAAPAPKQ